MSSGASITQWIADLKRGDPQAAEKLWQRYFERLVRLAKKKLRTPLRIADEEDVALSALLANPDRSPGGTCWPSL